MDRTHVSENEPKHPLDVTSDAAAQLTKIKTAGVNVGHEIAAYAKKEPLAAVAIALGGGFVLGSLVSSRLGRLVLMAAAGKVAQTVIVGALKGEGEDKLVGDEGPKAGNGSRRGS